MSKGSKRKGWKYQRNLRKAIGNQGRTSPAPVVRDDKFLAMTDEEIDKAYSLYGKFDRTQLKKRAAKERLRLQVKQILEQERGVK